jgi:hypothetical protein
MSFFYSNGIIDAIPDAETFEHNDLAGEYVGDTGSVISIQTGTVFDGSYALESGGTDTYYLITRDSNQAWNRDGIRVTYNQYMDPTGIGGVAYVTSKGGWGDVDGYRTHIDADNGNIRIYSFSGSNHTLLQADNGYSPTAGTWVDATVEFQSDGTIDFTWDGKNISVTDETYSDFYLAFFGFNATSYIDNVQFGKI